MGPLLFKKLLDRSIDGREQQVYFPCFLRVVA